jgi:hypothetical protein
MGVIQCSVGGEGVLSDVFGRFCNESGCFWVFQGLVVVTVFSCSVLSSLWSCSAS